MGGGDPPGLRPAGRRVAVGRAQFPRGPLGRTVAPRMRAWAGRRLGPAGLHGLGLQPPSLRGCGSSRSPAPCGVCPGPHIPGVGPRLLGELQRPPTPHPGGRTSREGVRCLHLLSPVPGHQRAAPAGRARRGPAAAVREAGVPRARPHSPCAGGNYANAFIFFLSSRCFTFSILLKDCLPCFFLKHLSFRGCPLLGWDGISFLQTTELKAPGITPPPSPAPLKYSFNVHLQQWASF